MRTIDDMLAELEQRELVADFTGIVRRHGVLLTDVMGPRRDSAISGARHECWSLLRERDGWSWKRIAKLFGLCSHVSVLKAVQRRQCKAIVAEARKGAA